MDHDSRLNLHLNQITALEKTSEKHDNQINENITDILNLKHGKTDQLLFDTRMDMIERKLKDF